MEQAQMLRMTKEFEHMVEEFFTVQCRYQAAMRQIRAKLENLDDEFQMQHSRNPIHSIETRMKSIASMVEKLQRNHMEVSVSSAVDNLFDIAGVRVICSYIADIYRIADLLTSQDDVYVLRVRDYIRKPKPNGYRSLHLVVEVPVYLSEGCTRVPVEIQIRTIAMDFWATLEHNLRYKSPDTIPEGISEELLQAAKDIEELDERMQSIRDRLGSHREEEAGRTDAAGKGEK